jgi:hypothetical protein
MRFRHSRNRVAEPGIESSKLLSDAHLSQYGTGYVNLGEKRNLGAPFPELDQRLLSPMKRSGRVIGSLFSSLVQFIESENIKTYILRSLQE